MDTGKTFITRKVTEHKNEKNSVVRFTNENIFIGKVNVSKNSIGVSPCYSNIYHNGHRAKTVLCTYIIFTALNKREIYQMKTIGSGEVFLSKRTLLWLFSRFKTSRKRRRWKTKGVCHWNAIKINPAQCFAFLKRFWDKAFPRRRAYFYVSVQTFKCHNALWVNIIVQLCET